MDKHFFDTVRPLFGKLTNEQVDALTKIVVYGKNNKYSKLHLAYILATIFHETAKWMVPIREGAIRYGRNYTDAQSRRAVASIHAKGIIRRNYALPGSYGNSFYGRGLVQTTHEVNYKKVGDMLGQDLVRYPDKLLEWNYALPATFEAMKKGMYTGKKLSMIKSRQDFTEARAIVNGDVRKNGPTIASHAGTFFKALANYGRSQPMRPKINSSASGMAKVTYDYNTYTIRNKPVTPSLFSRISEAVYAVYGDNAEAVIYSGGQNKVRRTGSVRHDNGKAADLYVYVNGNKITGVELAKLGQYWLANKYGCVGAEMGNTSKGTYGGIHLDQWTTPPNNGGYLWTYDFSDSKPWGKTIRDMLVAGHNGQLPDINVVSNNSSESSVLSVLIKLLMKLFKRS